MLRNLVEKVVKESKRVLIEREGDVRLMTLAVIAGGHVLVEGVPGIAKTLTARTVARLLGLSFSRIQMTPDLLPADIIGTKVYNQSMGEFSIVVGPINANIVLADEINRASPRTQSALLEAMQERQVTIEGVTIKLPEPFTVIATMNPIELEGVFPLPEAQLDRFFIKIAMMGLTDEGIRELLRKGITVVEEEFMRLSPVTSREELLSAREELKEVKVEEPVIEYVIRLCKAIGAHRTVKIGISPRGAAMVLMLAKELALLDGRDYVIPDDVKAAAMPALSHRIFLKPEFMAEGITGEDIVRQTLKSVEVPRP